MKHLILGDRLQIQKALTINHRFSEIAVMIGKLNIIHNYCEHNKIIHTMFIDNSMLSEHIIFVFKKINFFVFLQQFYIFLPLNICKEKIYQMRGGNNDRYFASLIVIF